MKSNSHDSRSKSSKDSRPAPVPKKQKSGKKQTETSVVRKRQNVYASVNIIVFISVIMFVGLCLIFLKRPTVSETENRELAKCPTLTLQSYLDGSFTDDFTAYFSDTVPYREQIVHMASVLNKLKGVTAPAFYGSVNVVADDEGKSTETAAVTSETTAAVPEDAETEERVTTAPSEVTTTETTTEEEVQNIAEFSNNGIVVDGVKMYGENAGVMLFGGNKACGTRYAEVISEYKKALGDDVNVYNMVVPTSVEFYLPKKYNKYSSSEKDAIDHIYQSYTADVIPVDAYSELSAHSEEYIYLRTDHHWSQRGAYYAYAAFVKALGETPLDIDKDYDIFEKTGFVGSLYGYTNDVTLQNSPETFTYYKPKSDYTTTYYKYDTLEEIGNGPLFYDNIGGTNYYGMFIGADAIHTKVVTKLNTGRKICVFKESYGNAFVPFLADSFDEIYVIDIRYFGRNAVEYMKEKGITDVMFIDNAFAANTNSLIDGIEKLLYNPYGTLDEAPEGMVTSAVSAETAITAETAAPAEQTSEINSDNQ